MHMHSTLNAIVAEGVHMQAMQLACRQDVLAAAAAGCTQLDMDKGVVLAWYHAEPAAQQ